MPPTQHTDTHTSWTDVAFEITTGRTVPSTSRQPFTSSEESLVAARRIGRSRSLSAPSIVPTSAKPSTPPLPPQLPQQSAGDAGKILVTECLSPQNTSAPSIASPEFITLPLADVRPPPTMPRSPVPAEDPVDTAHQARKLARYIDRVLLKRTQVNYQEESWLRKYEHLDESAEALKNALNQSAEALKTALADTNVRDVPPSHLESIAELQLQFRTDFNAIKARNKAFRDAQSSLSSLEFRLAAKESIIVDVISSFAGRLPSDASDTDSFGELEAASAKSDTPSLLRRFYERMGDEGVFSERLHEQALFHEEGLIERGLVADRGDTLAIDDEQFENDRRVEREKIQSDLWSAQEDVARLKAECEAVGLNTEVRRQPSESLSFSHPYPVEDEVYALPIIWDNFLRDLDGQPYPKGTSTPGGPDGDVIRGWLDKVTVEPIDVRDTTLTALEETTVEAYDDSVDPLPASHDDSAAHEALLNEIPAVSWSSRQPLRYRSQP
ncbi:hypothetical protein LTR12_008782 [Friedmanniomyces endolithicus]|nr:hypothetical protein LTR12_008782 [Friedmanniomyces endolithicus]